MSLVGPVLRNRSVPASLLLKRFKRLFLPLVMLTAALGSAWAAKGTVSGTEMQGFGRIVFSFDKEVGAKFRVQNSIMIIEFDEQVTVDLQKLNQQLPGYVSIARADPDGKSLRLALTSTYKADMKPAGERIYLDILSLRWQGHPPPLPQEVVQDLVRRARNAEDQLRRVSRDAEKVTQRDLEVRVATAPRFKRVIFQMPRTAPVVLVEKNDDLTLIFDANFRVSAELLRARLAGLVQEVSVEQTEETLRIQLKPQNGFIVKGFREDDAYTLDFSRTDGAPVDEVAELAPQTPGNPPTAVAPASSAPGVAPQTKAADTKVPGSPALTANRNEQPKQITIKDLSEIEPAIAAHVETGDDPQGFALRLANLGEAPVAVLQRGRSLIVLVEAVEAVNMPSIPADLARNIEALTVNRIRNASVLRVVPVQEGRFWLKRDGKHLVIQRGKSSGDQGYSGTTIGVRRAFDANGREALEALVGGKGGLHMIDDPASGQRIAVVPIPGAELASPKGLAFAEFSIEPTLAGFAVHALDEAVTIKRQPESVVIGHEIKLNLSNLPQEQLEAADASRGQRALMLDIDGWQEDTRGTIRLIERNLLRAAAEAPRVNRSEARLRLARFYVANGFYPEAAAVLDVVAADDNAAAATKQALILRAFSATMMGRLVEASRVLSEPAFAMEGEQKLLQAVVDAKGMRYPQAVLNFRQTTAELDRYPEAIQAQFRRLAIEAAIESGDVVFAREQLSVLEKVPPRFSSPHILQLLAGRLAMSQNRTADALQAFTQATGSPDRSIEAEARFGKVGASLAEGRIQPEDARAEYETLTAIWRRSEVELKSLERLGEFYAAEGRWREAFLAAQRATAIMPEHPATRRLEEAMGRRFENLFLDKEGDKLSKVEALALYHEFRSLIPIGRRGDEIARRLADRLFDLDLVNEAAEILEHQVKNRLEGVARASVATRLAVMHLQNRKPVQALTALRSTRLSSLPNDLRRARTLLEARALGDQFRTDLAIEILANDQGDDIDRLRADIHWKGKRWREAGEGYERVLADAWQREEPLNETQRLDAMRSGLAYVLGEEKLALDRLRARYLAKMAKTEDAGAFNLLTNDKITRPQAFRDAARSVVNADTMTDFMAAYRKRYPESGGAARPVRSAGDGRQSSIERKEQPVPGNG